MGGSGAQCRRKASKGVGGMPLLRRVGRDGARRGGGLCPEREAMPRLAAPGRRLCWGASKLRARSRPRPRAHVAYVHSLKKANQRPRGPGRGAPRASAGALGASGPPAAQGTGREFERPAPGRVTWRRLDGDVMTSLHFHAGRNRTADGGGGPARGAGPGERHPAVAKPQVAGRGECGRGRPRPRPSFEEEKGGERSAPRRGRPAASARRPGWAIRPWARGSG